MVSGVVGRDPARQVYAHRRLGFRVVGLGLARQVYAHRRVGFRVEGLGFGATGVCTQA